MSLRYGLVREVAFSTPERDRGSDRERDHDASSLPFELPAPRKRQPRNTTEQSGRYRRPLSQPDPSAYDSDTIPIGSSQPDPRTRRSTTTNKDVLVALTEIIRQPIETIRNLEHEPPKSKVSSGRISIDHGSLLAAGGGLVRKQLSHSRKKQSETRTTFLLSTNTSSAFTLLLSSFA
jgi:hypothetical protein